jgi:predicted AlkP superfamily phosphohydrolase/phosphomutase
VGPVDAGHGARVQDEHRGPMTTRILFVGWDGADWAVLEPLIAAGRLPNLASLRNGGRWGYLESTFPPHSVAAWTSFLTGLPAASHGVIDFRDYRPGRYFPEIPRAAESVPSPDLLDVLSQHGRRVLCANIPMTFPPKPINGMLISGVFLPRGRPFTFPSDLGRELEAVGGFPVNGLEWAAEESLEHLFDEARTLIKQRTRVFAELLGRERWDVALLAYMAPDRLQHAAFHLLDPTHPYRTRDPNGDQLRASLISVFEELDRSLGVLLDAANAESLVVASDHGFRPVWFQLVPNRLLERMGYLRYRGGRAGLRRALRPVRRLFSGSSLAGAGRKALGAEASIDWTRSDAYCPSILSQGVRLNLQGREPRGTVPSSRADSLLSELLDELIDARLPDGNPLFAAVRPKEDVLGDQPSNASFPDIFLWPAAGVGLAMEGSREVSPTVRKTGEHRQEGIILMKGENREPLPRAIWEIPNRILQLSEIDPQGWSPTTGGKSNASRAITPEDEDSIVEHLQGLGYVE